jgi:hypothetical protein
MVKAVVPVVVPGAPVVRAVFCSDEPSHWPGRPPAMRVRRPPLTLPARVLPAFELAIDRLTPAQADLHVWPVGWSAALMAGLRPTLDEAIDAAAGTGTLRGVRLGPLLHGVPPQGRRRAGVRVRFTDPVAGGAVCVVEALTRLWPLDAPVLIQLSAFP